MIIQCEECGTRYRFDESLMEGEGVWVRCSRCMNVFFQENPAAEKIVIPTDMAAGEMADEKELKIDAIPADRFEEVIGTTGDAFLKKEEPEFRWDGEFEERHIPVDIYGDAAVAAEGKKTFGEFDDRLTDELTERGEDARHGEAVPDKKEAGPRRRGRLFVYAAAACAALAGASFWFFPQHTREFVRSASRILTVQERVGEEESARKPLAGKRKEVELGGMRDHSVENWIVGTLFVIEGIAVNKSGHLISKARVRGSLVDSSGNVVAQERSVVGNILTDEELRNLTKEEIIGELSKSWGRDVASPEIPPEGSVPFMIVFCNPPDSANKYAVDCERAHDTGKQ